MCCVQERQLSLYLLCSYLPRSRNCTHPCAFHNFDTLRHILVIFGRNEEEDQKGCHMQERQLSLFLLSSYLPLS